jgi:LysM repeat protein
MDDLINDLADDIQENQSSRILRDRRSPLYTISQGKILLFGGAGLLVLIILVVLLFLGGKEAPSEDLSLIQARLTRVESRIKTTGALESRIQQVEEQEKEVRQSLLKTDLSIRTIKGDLNQLIQEFESLQKKRPPAPQKVETPKGVKGASISETEKGYHVVSRGETLYRISKKYGISLDDLRRLNKMDPNALIHPGQKLLVVQEKSE